MAHTRSDIIKAKQDVISAHAGYRKILQGVVAAMDNVERAISMLGDLPPTILTTLDGIDEAEVNRIAERLSPGNGRAM